MIKNNKILEIKNFNTPLNMDFSNKLYIDIPNLSSKVKVEDNLFVIVEDLVKFTTIQNFYKIIL